MILRPVTSHSLRTRPARRRERRGFTLVEVLLALAVLGLVAALFIAGTSTFFRAVEPRPEDVFWQAVHAARQQSVESARTVYLHFDGKQAALVASAPGLAQQVTPFPGKSLEFLSAIEQRAVLIGGQVTDTATIPGVRFHPEGTCDPFRAQLVDAAGRRVLLHIDPWTCAPVLPATP